MTHGDMRSPDEILASLDPQSVKDWQAVGSVIYGLERKGRIAPDGRPWIALVKDRLENLQHPVSMGHLHKIRRSYEFLSNGLRSLKVPAEQARQARISSVEIADRLYNLDHEEGLGALAACIDPQRPATAAEISRRYQTYVEKHPEKLTVLQASWKQRKKPEASWPAGFPEILRGLQDYVASLHSMIEARDAQINDLKEDLEETQHALREAETHLEYAKMMIPTPEERWR